MYDGSAVAAMPSCTAAMRRTGLVHARVLAGGFTPIVSFLGTGSPVTTNSKLVLSNFVSVSGVQPRCVHVRGCGPVPVYACAWESERPPLSPLPRQGFLP